MVALIRVLDGVFCTMPCLYIGASLLTSVNLEVMPKKLEFIVAIVGLSLALGISLATLVNF